MFASVCVCLFSLFFLHKRKAAVHAVSHWLHITFLGALSVSVHVALPVLDSCSVWTIVNSTALLVRAENNKEK